MRNEIYARYNYKFREGGEMDRHFKKQDWYQDNYENVEQWFTEFELKNIETIKRIEKENPPKSGPRFSEAQQKEQAGDNENHQSPSPGSSRKIGNTR